MILEEKIFELMSKMYTDMHEMKENIATKEDIKEVKQDIAMLEDSHGRKLDALFDGYKANTEAIEKLTKKVENHEVKLQIVK